MLDSSALRLEEMPLQLSMLNRPHIGKSSGV